FAVGEATSAELEAAWRATWEVREEDGLSDDPLANARFWARDAVSQTACDLDRASAVATSAAWAVSWKSGAPADAAFDRERVAQCDLWRCLCGNPFRRPPVIEDTWLAWGDGIVGRLARSIHDAHRFEDMPILADALEDAGCDDAGLLDHLRDPGTHARECHV